MSSHSKFEHIVVLKNTDAYTNTANGYTVKLEHAIKNIIDIHLFYVSVSGAIALFPIGSQVAYLDIKELGQFARSSANGSTFCFTTDGNIDANNVLEFRANREFEQKIHLPHHSTLRDFTVKFYNINGTPIDVSGVNATVILKIHQEVE